MEEKFKKKKKNYKAATQIPRNTCPHPPTQTFKKILLFNWFSRKAIYLHGSCCLAAVKIKSYFCKDDDKTIFRPLPSTATKKIESTNYKHTKPVLSPKIFLCV